MGRGWNPRAMPPPVYLDHQSASPLRPEVREAMLPYLDGQWGNPSSLHRRGQKARQALRHAREQAAAFLNAKDADDIIFTASGTEAANLALMGAAIGDPKADDQPGSILTSATEHPAVLACAQRLAARGWQHIVTPMDREGRLDLKGDPFGEIYQALEDGIPLLAALHLANHDVGTLQPVEDFAGLIHGHIGVVFCDATAAAGWRPIDVRALDADLLSVSPQRIGGPVGVGVLYRQPGVQLTPQMVGGQQEGGLRGGTENLPAIVGAGVALELAGRELEQRVAHVARLQTMLLNGLRERVPDLHLNGPEPGPERLPNQLNLSVAGLEGEALLLALDVAGVQIHAGASCVSKQLRTPPVLAAIGLEPGLARASVTLSLGPENTEEEIHRVLEVFPKVTARLRAMSPSRGGPPVRVAKPTP